jgi:hypothetical protein
MVLNGNNHNTFVSAIETVMFAEDSERVMKQYFSVLRRASVSKPTLETLPPPKSEMPSHFAGSLIRRVRTIKRFAGVAQRFARKCCPGDLA